MTNVATAPSSERTPAAPSEMTDEDQYLRFMNVNNHPNYGITEVLIHSDYVHLFIFDSCLFLLEYHGDLIHPELDETGCLPQFNILFRLKNGVMIWFQRDFTIFWYIFWMDFEWIETTSRESMAADLGIQGWTGLWGGRNHGLAAASWVPYPYRCPQTWLDSFLSVASRVFREPIILGYM